MRFEVVAPVPPLESLKTRIVTLCQSSVEDGNDSPTIVSGEQSPTLDQCIEAGRICDGFCVVLCGECRFSLEMPWRFESPCAHYFFVHDLSMYSSRLVL